MFECEICKKIFSKKYNRDRHFKSHVNQGRIYECLICSSSFYHIQELQRHRALHTSKNIFKVHNSAFSRNCLTYRKIHNQNISSINEAYLSDKNQLTDLLQIEIVKKGYIKTCVIYHIEFIKHDASQNVIDMIEICIRKKYTTLARKEDIALFLHESRTHAEQRVEDFTEHGSGWIFNDVLCTDLEIGACAPLNGSCSRMKVKYLKTLNTIKSNAQNSGNNCFLKAIACYFEKTSNKQVLQNFIKDNMNVNIPMPANVSDIARFEKANVHLNLKIVILREEGGNIYPIYNSGRKAKHRIPLILYNTAFNNKVLRHYALIENLDIFLRREYRGGNNKKEYEKSFRCHNCLAKFSVEFHRDRHEAECESFNPMKTETPQPETFLSFTKTITQFKVPIIGFFDFESALRKGKYKCMKCESNNCAHKTVSINKHEPVCFSLVILNHNQKIIHKKSYVGKDCMDVFINELLRIEDTLQKIIIKNIAMITSPEDITAFKKATHCHICQSELKKDKVRDHNHLTGEYLGAAHSLCNLRRTESRRIKLFAHNLQGYDSHFILKHLKEDERIRKLTGLTSNTQRLRTFSINSYEFTDSFAFLSSSLDKLVSNLHEEHTYPILNMSGLYTQENKTLKALLLRKGIFPYEFVDSFQKLKGKCLPPREEFYSKLTNSEISEEDYKHAQNVFAKLKCKNMEAYCKAYCLLDVCLLAEVMIQFREEIYTETGIDCW